MPNIVKGFFNVKERCHYLFTSVETFQNSLWQVEKMVFVDLAFLKPDWYLVRKPVSLRCFRRHFPMTRSKFHDGTK